MWAVHENGGDTWSDKFNDRLDLYLVSAKFNELAEKTRIQYDCVAKTLREFFRDATLSSINPDYPPRVVPRRDIEWMARILWVSQ
jgi:hypothetical protein